MDSKIVEEFESRFVEEVTDMLLVVSPSGEITAYYSENEDLLGGHAVEITADIDGTVESAYLVG